MSVYPAQVDTAFPGYPYVDNTEYITAGAANAWVQALIAIEQTIGAGSGSQSPLYSSVFGAAYTTLAARIGNVEAVAAARPQLDGAPQDIQPVGAAPLAGGSGHAADAGHVHVGVTSLNGLQGAVTLAVEQLATAFTQPGQLLVGGATGSGELLPPGTLGQVLAVQSGPSLGWGSGVFFPGDLKLTAALVPPSGWLVADGSAVSRATYPDLLNALTFSFSATAFTSSGQYLLGSTGVFPTAVLQSVGSTSSQACAIEGPGLLPGSSVILVDTSTLQLVSGGPATAGAGTFTLFPYGAGDGSSTFNVVDGRGRMGVGVGGIGGLAQPTYLFGQTGGEQLHYLSVSELASHNHPITDPGHLHTATTGPENATHTHYNQNNYGYLTPVAVANGWYLNGYEGGFPVAEGSPVTSTEDVTHAHDVVTDIAQTEVSVDNAGLGGGHNNMPPFFGAQWIIKY